jgi:HK97 family phage prohead protease
MQTKTLDVPLLQVKTLTDRHFEGHGAVFNNVDMGGEIVMPGAFLKSLAEHQKIGTWPSMLWMHQRDEVPGVWHEISEDKSGLYVKGEILDTTLGNDVYKLLSKKAVRGLSIGYRERDYDFDRNGNRRLKEVYLGEVSIVSTAMNPLARVESVKARLSAEGVYVPDVREFEKFLRKNGYSRVFAEHACKKLFGDAAFLSDPEEDRGEPDGEAMAVLESLKRATKTIAADDISALMLQMAKTFR